MSFLMTKDSSSNIKIMRNHTIVVFERLCTSFAFLLNNSLLEFMSRIFSLDSSGVPIYSEKGCHKGYINHPGTLCSPTTEELLKKKVFSEYIYVNRDSVNKHTISQVYSCFYKSKSPDDPNITGCDFTLNEVDILEQMDGKQSNGDEESTITMSEGVRHGSMEDLFGFTTSTRRKKSKKQKGKGTSNIPLLV